MANTSPFNNFASEYDSWFDRNKSTYLQELEAVRQMIPGSGFGLEIGAGTGRFAGPLGIRIGIEPSVSMGRMATERGIDVVQGVAESLPFVSGSFNFALFVTVICFLGDVQRSMDEAFRVLTRRGEIVVAFIDKNSRMGKKYSEKVKKSRFYPNASFYSLGEVMQVLGKSGFSSFQFIQTLIEDKGAGCFSSQVKEGYGEGSFVVVNGKKP